MPGKFEYKIVKQIAVISKRETDRAVYTKELNLISYNGNEPIYDLRTWIKTKGQEPQMMKGLTLNKEEIKALSAAVQKLF